MRPGVCWVRWADQGAHYWALGSCGVVAFIRGGFRVRVGGRWVYPGSLGSLACALAVVGFVRDRLVHSGASLGSSGFLWFIRERPGSVAFIRVVGFILGRWVHSVAPWGSFGSSGVVRITQLRPGYRWIHMGSFGSLRCALGVFGFIRVRLVHSGAPRGALGSSGVVGFTPVRPGCRCVHPWSIGSLGCALWVVGFILGGTQVCPGGSWVHTGSFGSLRCALGVFGFIRVRCVRSGAPWGTLGSLG